MSLEETALAFARSGGKLVLAGRNRDALEDVRSSVEQAGGQAIVVAGDVTDAEWRRSCSPLPPCQHCGKATVPKPCWRV